MVLTNTLSETLQFSFLRIGSTVVLSPYFALFSFGLVCFACFWCNIFSLKCTLLIVHCTRCSEPLFSPTTQKLHDEPCVLCWIQCTTSSTQQCAQCKLYNVLTVHLQVLLALLCRGKEGGNGLTGPCQKARLSMESFLN